MNSCNNINKNNVMNLSNRLSLNQFESNEDLIRFPFDNIYTSNSNAPRRTFPFDKQAGEPWRPLVEDNAEENRNMNDILNAQIMFNELQNKTIVNNLIQIQGLKKENKALKNKLTDIGHMCLNATEQRISTQPNMTYQNKATSTITSADLDISNETEPVLPFQQPPENIKNQNIISTLELIQNNKKLTVEHINKAANKKTDKTNIGKQPAQAPAKSTTTTKQRMPNRKSPPATINCGVKMPMQKGRNRSVAENLLALNQSQNEAPSQKVVQATGTNREILQPVYDAQSSNDPYHLGEDDLRENSPITNLVSIRKISSARMPSEKTKSIFNFPGVLCANESQFNITNDESASQVMMASENANVDQDAASSFGVATSSGVANPSGASISLGIPSSSGVANPSDASISMGIPSSSGVATGLDVDSSLADILAGFPTLPEIHSPSIYLNSPGSAFSFGVSATDLCGTVGIKSDVANKSNKKICKRPLCKDNDTHPTESNNVKKMRESCKKTEPAAPSCTATHSFPKFIGGSSNDWFDFISCGELDSYDNIFGIENVEVPQWRICEYEPVFRCICPEFANDATFEKRHTKHENEEKRQQRWHMRRIREQRHVERLRQRHKDAWSNMPVLAPPVYTLWPRPHRDMHELHITNILPVGALGEDVPDLQQAEFKLPWIRRMKTSQRLKRTKSFQ